MEVLPVVEPLHSSRRATSARRRAPSPRTTAARTVSSARRRPQARLAPASPRQATATISDEVKASSYTLALQGIQPEARGVDVAALVVAEGDYVRHCTALSTVASAHQSLKTTTPRYFPQETSHASRLELAWHGAALGARFNAIALSCLESSPAVAHECLQRALHVAPREETEHAMSLCHLGALYLQPQAPYHAPGKAINILIRAAHCKRVDAETHARVRLNLCAAYSSAGRHREALFCANEADTLLIDAARWHGLGRWHTYDNTRHGGGGPHHAPPMPHAADPLASLRAIAWHNMACAHEHMGKSDLAQSAAAHAMELAGYAHGSEGAASGRGDDLLARLRAVHLERKSGGGRSPRGSRPDSGSPSSTRRAMPTAARRTMSAKDVATDGLSMREQLEAAGVALPDEKEVIALSRLFNARIDNILSDSRAQAAVWSRVFKDFDDDQSGLITFDELASGVRERLKIKKNELSEVRLQALWLILDTDDSGFIESAEFQRFMRREAPPPLTNERRAELLREKRLAQRAAAERDKEKELVLDGFKGTQVHTRRLHLYLWVFANDDYHNYLLLCHWFTNTDLRGQPLVCVCARACLYVCRALGACAMSSMRRASAWPMRANRSTWPSPSASGSVATCQTYRRALRGSRSSRRSTMYALVTGRTHSANVLSSTRALTRVPRASL